MKNILLIVNPVAGKKKAKSTLVDVLSVLEKDGSAVTVMLTKERGHASRIAEDKGADYDEIVCFGGDGTLNETISGIMKAGISVPLGYIPAGSTNDFASSIKLSDVPQKAAEDIVNGEARPIDIGCFCGSRYFTYIAAFGVFTATSYSVPQGFKNVFGHLAYILGGVKEVGHIRSYHVKVTTEDRVIEDDFMFGAVANSTSVAGIVKLKPELVDMSDGLFEVALIKKPHNIGELNKIITALTKSDFSKNVIEFYKASSITVDSEGDFAWTLDGEYAEGTGTVLIENKKCAVDFIKNQE